jgi:hypothetical protein
MHSFGNFLPILHGYKWTEDGVDWKRTILAQPLVLRLTVVLAPERGLQGNWDG